MLTIRISHAMITFLIILSSRTKYGHSANILYISAIPSPSHHIWNRAFAFGLVEKGHNITFMGPEKDKYTPANYSHILIEGAYEAFLESVDPREFADYGPFQTILGFVDMCEWFCTMFLNSEALQQLLQYPSNKFDLLIFDASAGSCFYPLIQKFNYPPSIAVTHFLLPPYLAYNFGNPLYPEYVPWYGLPYTSDMSLIQSFWNHVFMYGETAIKNIYQKKFEEAAVKQIFGDDLPSMDVLERHVSLLLANTDPVLNYPQALAPNVIPVGGLHTSRAKEIPKDLEKILDDAENGIVLFSLGTNMRSNMLDNKTQKALIEAFSELSETVIWKFESELETVPENVITRKWLPQNDILGHPNVKLFIGHGGALSTQEAMYHGVPVLCIPFFFDQHANARDIENRKLGVALDYKKITTDTILVKIREVLNNPIYCTNMKKVSRVFKDRTESPLERAIFWAEYVIRNNGAEFLSTPARDLPFYKAMGLDVALLVVLVCLVVHFVLSKISRLVVSLWGSTRKLKMS